MFGESLGDRNNQADIYEDIDKELLKAIKRLYGQARKGFYRPLANTIREDEKLSEEKKELTTLEKATILALKIEEDKFNDLAE